MEDIYLKSDAVVLTKTGGRLKMLRHKQNVKLYMTILFLFFSSNTFSQVFVRTLDGKNYWSKLNFEKIEKEDYISVNDGRRILRISKSDILLIEDMEEGLEILQPDKVNKVKPEAFNDNLAAFFAANKKVYIPLASNAMQQRWGAKRLRELVEENYFWQLVGCEEEADLIMEYVFDDRGSDHAYLLFSDRNGTKVLSTSNVSASDFIAVHAGEESAEELFKNHFIYGIVSGNIEKKTRKSKNLNEKNHFALYYLKW